MNTRNPGIDFARILSMLFVVGLHNLLNGGILDLNSATGKNMTYLFIENLVIVAVNLFAMISGFLMTDRKLRISKIRSLWYVVLFWSVVPTITLMLVLRKFNVALLIRSFFPIIFNQYWYFNAYIVLVLFIPFLNAGIDLMETESLKKIVILLVILSGTIGFIGHLFENGGYSVIWLMIMYLLGAFVKKNMVQNSSALLLVMVYVIGACISLVGEYISLNYIGHIKMWLNYNSPIVIIQSICLFIFCVEVKIKNKRVLHLLKLISPLTFSVYLIDANPFFFNKFLHSNFTFINSLNVFEGVILFFLSWKIL